MNPLLLSTFGLTGALAQYEIAVADTTTAGNALRSGAGTERFLGVASEPSPAGACTLVLVGTAKVRAGAAVTAGNRIASNSAGLGVPITPAVTGGNVRQVVGIALTSAASGELFTLLIQPMLTEGA